MLSINSNIMSSRAQSAVRGSDVEIAREMEKLSTAKRVNSATDDPSGAAIINRMTSQVRGAAQAIRNVQDGISLIQTVDGALGQMEEMAQRMRELTVQSLNDTLSPLDREMLDVEFQSIKRQMISVTQQTTWNQTSLLQPRVEVLERIQPAFVAGQSAIDTSAPIDGTYKIFINDQVVNVDLIQDEPSLQRLNKIAFAINADTRTHGVVANINELSAIELFTPDGRDLAVAYESVNNALSGINLGLGSARQAQVNQLNITPTNSNYPTFTQGDGYLEFSGYGGGGESIAWTNSGQPVIQANQFSIANGTLYKGTGVGATVLGAVDSVRNGVAGQPLRINLQKTFINGSFETSANGSIPGWTVENRWVQLNGQDTISGYPVPSDTNLPLGSSGESSNVMGGRFTASLTGVSASSGNQSLMLEMKDLLVPAYGVAHGPALVSDSPVAIQAGQPVSFDWKAEQGGDKYDVYAYLLNVDDGSTQELLNRTGTFTDWSTVALTVNKTGNYKFVFIAGAFDATGGTAVGAKLYVDNIKAGLDLSQKALSSADFDSIGSLINYTDQTPFSLSVSINNLNFSSDLRSTTADAWESLYQKIATQSDSRIANIQFINTGDGLTIKSKNPGEGFTVSAVSTTSQTFALRDEMLTSNETLGDAISAIQSSNDLASILVFKGLQVPAQDLDSARFLKIHLGANSNQYVDIELPDYGTPGGSIDALVWDAQESPAKTASVNLSRIAMNVRTSASSLLALEEMDTTISSFLNDRARLGAMTNRLIYAGNNLVEMQTQQTKSRSVIQDTDFAASSSKLIKSQIVNQAAMSVLTQANGQSQLVMELLRSFD